MAFSLSVKIHNITKNFPKEEQYSLTDQIRRSSRSVCTCVAEGYRKRRYPKHFINKLSTACSEIGFLLNYMINNPEKYL
jgi:four helix bundle protein